MFSMRTMNFVPDSLVMTFISGLLIETMLPSFIASVYCLAFCPPFALAVSEKVGALISARNINSPTKSLVDFNFIGLSPIGKCILCSGIGAFHIVATVYAAFVILVMQLGATVVTFAIKPQIN